MIKLTMVTGEVQAERDGEDDGIVPIRQAQAETTCPVRVDPGQVRCFYPRKGNRQGTRLTFHNSAGMAVTESFEEVERLFQSA